MRLADHAIRLSGQIAAWLFVIAGAALTYEVVARYVFQSPTIWAAEISELLLIWGVYLAMPRTLSYGENISIDILYLHLPAPLKRVAGVCTLIFIAAFCAVVFFYGADIAWHSFTRGGRTGTMLNLPRWWIELAVPVGFGLSLAACATGLVRHATKASVSPTENGTGP